MQQVTMEEIDQADQMPGFMEKLDLNDMGKGLDEIDLEMRLHIDVSGPRWHSDNVLYSGHYVF